MSPPCSELFSVSPLLRVHSEFLHLNPPSLASLNHWGLSNHVLHSFNSSALPMKSLPFKVPSKSHSSYVPEHCQSRQSFYILTSRASIPINTHLAECKGGWGPSSVPTGFGTWNHNSMCLNFHFSHV